MSQLPKKNSGGSSGSGSGGNRPPVGGAKSSGSSGGSGSGSGRPANKPGGTLPARTSGGSGGSGSGGGSRSGRPASYQSGNRPQSGGRPPATRQPVGRGGRPMQPQSSFDRNFPPYSTRRYLAIWIPVMVVVAIVFIFLLLTLNNNNSNNATAQQTPAAQPGLAGNGATAAPQPAGGQGASQPTSPPAPAVAVVTATQSLTGTGTYMVIDTVKGTITCKLYTDPSAGVSKTIANFVSKANAKYFDGLLFHRVEDWVIQGGDPLSKDPSSITSGLAGTGGGSMPAEYNNIPFDVGALGVARGSDPAINNDSQFFIVKNATEAAGLVGMYTNFGQVISGIDVVNKIAIGDKINSITIQNK